MWLVRLFNLQVPLRTKNEWKLNKNKQIFNGILYYETAEANEYLMFPNYTYWSYLFKY